MEIKMKKLISLWMAMLLVFLLCACGEQSDSRSKKQKKMNPPGQTQSQPVDDSEQNSSEDETVDTMNETIPEEEYVTDQAGHTLTVETSIEHLASDGNRQFRTSDYLMDNKNKDIFVRTGANEQALAKRKQVRESADRLTVSGNTYYVSIDGSDENTGLSPTKPFASVGKANGVVQPGDAILLKRGDVFRLNSGITLANGVKYGAYGTGEKPELWGSVRNYAQSDLWTPHKIENVWKMSYSGTDVGLMVFDHGALTGDMNFYIRSMSENGDYYYDDVEHMLYLYCDCGNPGKVYRDIEIGCRMILFRLQNGGHDVAIDNLCFKYTGTFAIRGTNGCHDITITNCEIGWIGGSLFEDGSNRFGNGIEFLIGAQDILVENCWIYQVYDAGFTFQHSTSGDRTNLFRDICVRNNLIEYCSWAIEWYPTDDSATIERITFADNILRLSGYGIAGDTRDPSLIHGPWLRSGFTVSDFVVKNNIFDTANGSVYYWIFSNNAQPGHQLIGNTYYQQKTPDGKFPIWEYGKGDLNDPAMISYADSQASMETVVAKLDSAAKKVTWIG